MKQKIKQCIDKKMTMVESALYLGVSKSTIQRACKKWDLIL